MLETINTDCECLPLARSDINRKLETGTLPMQAEELLRSRETIFARTPVFVSAADHKAMLGTISAIEDLTKLEDYRVAIAARTPFTDDKTHGLIMGYDFHLTDDGPKLIEVNTNAGGAFIVSHLLRALEPNISCCYNSKIYGADTQPDSIDEFIIDMFRREYKRGGATEKLASLAIIDENPTQQYLYPDMLIAKDLLDASGVQTVIVDPADLDYRDGHLRAGALPIDMVYNRLTDFDLSDPRHKALRRAYENQDVVLSPAPSHHALFADKRNLILFGDTEALQQWGLSNCHISALKAVPKTLELTPENADEMWAVRKQYFFKPRDGFGSKAAYRGKKITRKVWEQISGGSHVAQEFVPPSLRLVRLEGEPEAVPIKLKFDLRVYTYGGQAFSMVARVYQGQTTNFRTRGGGFAPVIVMADNK